MLKKITLALGLLICTSAPVSCIGWMESAKETYGYHVLTNAPLKEKLIRLGQVGLLAYPLLKKLFRSKFPSGRTVISEVALFWLLEYYERRTSARVTKEITTS